MVLWQPGGADLERPRRLEHNLFHHSGNPQALARWIEERAPQG